MVKYELIKESKEKLDYSYYPEGRRDRKAGVITIDRGKKKSISLKWQNTTTKSLSYMIYSIKRFVNFFFANSSFNGVSTENNPDRF